MDFNVDFNNDFGFFGTTDLNLATISLNCFDNNSPTMWYNIRMGDTNVLNGSYATGSVQTVDVSVLNDFSDIWLSCRDLAGNLITDTNSFEIYFNRFDL